MRNYYDTVAHGLDIFRECLRTNFVKIFVVKISADEWRSTFETQWRIDADIRYNPTIRVKRQPISDYKRKLHATCHPGTFLLHLFHHSILNVLAFSSMQFTHRAIFWFWLLLISVWLLGCDKLAGLLLKLRNVAFIILLNLQSCRVRTISCGVILYCFALVGFSA